MQGQRSGTVGGEQRQRIQELAERYVAAWVSDPPWRPDSYEADHVEKITERVIAALEGREERPWLHSHADSELGVCTECDAANVLWQFEDEASSAEAEPTDRST